MSNEFLTKHVAKFTYDFAVNGGVKGTSIDLGGLPDDALIVNGFAEVITKPVDADAGDDTTVSIGYTGATAAFLPLTAVSGLTAGLAVKLIPGVMNVGSGQAITTVDTPAEAVAVTRVSGDTFSIIKLTASKRVLFSIENSQNLTAGKINIYLEYVVSK
jgi:hypothetical protein